MQPIQQFPASKYYSDFAGSQDYAKSHSIGLIMARWSADWPSGFGFLDQIIDGTSLKKAGGTNLSYVNDPAINATGSTLCTAATFCVKEFKNDPSLGDYGFCKNPGNSQGRCGIPCNDLQQNHCSAGNADALCPFNSICRAAHDLNGGSGQYCIPGACR